MINHLYNNIYQVSVLQDKHTASSFFRMSWKELPQSKYKSTKIRDNGVPYHRFYFDLQFNTSILFRLRHSNSFSKLIHFLSEPAYVWNPVYVEAESSLRVLFERATPPSLRATSPIFCVAKHPVMLWGTAGEEFCGILLSCNSGIKLLSLHIEYIGEITRFWGNDLATVPFAAFCHELLFK